MVHRHLNHDGLTLAAIDDIIARGSMHDWQRLRDALASESSLREKVEQVSGARLEDRYAQRHHFWRKYVQQLNA